MWCEEPFDLIKINRVGQNPRGLLRHLRESRPAHDVDSCAMQNGSSGEPNNLGVPRQEQADVANLRARYELAITRGWYKGAGYQAFELGKRLAEYGDVADARVAYQQAIDSGNPRLCSPGQLPTSGCCSPSRGM